MKRNKKRASRGHSGPLGNMISGSWKGIDYLRSSPTPSKKPSQKQLEQRAKFSTVMHFARIINDLLMETFNGYANQMTGVNMAISDILKRAITGTYPSYNIAYRKVFISRGSLPNAEHAVASAGASGTIEFNWTYGAENFGKAKPVDQVLLVAYCPENNRAVYRTGALRSAMTDTLSVKGFKNKGVQTWITFLSEDGKDVADSVFTGEITVTG